MNIVNELSDDAVLHEFGSRISASRIGSRMTQEELARRAGVSKRSIERLECGEGGVRLQIVIAVARALRRLGGLNALFPAAQTSPYDMAANHKAPLKRVRARKASAGAFKWGE